MTARNVLMALVAAFATLAVQANAINLGSAANFALLGATGVTNVGFSIIHDRNVGSSPTPAISGFPPGVVSNGILYLDADPVTALAHADLGIAYNEASIAPGGVPGPLDLGGQTLEPGVYTYAGIAGWSEGALTLDGMNDPNSEWIFQIGTGLTTPAGASVHLINGANAENVFWQVGSSAIFGATNNFAGNILAFTSITFGGGTLNGRALAVNGLVSISTAQTTVPEPGMSSSVAMALLSLLALTLRRSRRRVQAVSRAAV